MYLYISCIFNALGSKLGCYNVQLEPEGDFLVEPDCILERREISLWNRTICQVNVQWKNLSLEEATWKLEIHMQDAYPILFQGNSEEEE